VSIFKNRFFHQNHYIMKLFAPPVLLTHLFPGIMALLLGLSLPPSQAIAQAPPCCTPKSCNLNCFGDMEAFASDAELRQALCAAPANDAEATFEFDDVVNQKNTPCVFESPVNISNVCSGSEVPNVMAPQGSRMLSMFSGGGDGSFFRIEGVAFPLCSPVTDGACIVVRFWASRPATCAGTFTARIEFMADPPVSQQNVYNNPGGVSAATNVNITHNLPDFGLYTVTIQHPDNGIPWNFMLFSLRRPGFTDYFPGRAVFDDIQVIRPEATFSQSVDCQTATFTSATDCDNVVTHLWDFGDGVTSTETNPIHFYLQPGNYTVTHTVSLSCNGGQQSLSEQQNVNVTSCPQEFTCPCENGINIDAKGGLPVSALGISQLDLSQYNNCLAIKGNLIIDQNFTVSNGDIRMQPCSEITIQGSSTPNIYPSLELTGNSIYGCETMWKGITVSANTRLVLLGNSISDAEYAVKAFGGSPSWLYPPATRIEVRNNSFVKNHIGIFIPNNFTSGIVSHIPIEGNSFAGNLPGQSLLPPCNPQLSNYNVSYGYSGIATLFNELVVGTPGDGTGTSNSFSQLANGIIGEYSTLQVYHCEFNNIQAGWINSIFGFPSFAKSQGIAILANGGSATVSDSRFDISPHGVYGVNNYNFRIGRNEMPSVTTGIESYGTYNLRISDNPDISFSLAGIKCRELRTGLFVSEFITGNKFLSRSYPTVIYPVPFDFPAISVENGNSVQLPQARISGNIANYAQYYQKGITIRGTENWTIDDNHISSSALVDDAGFRLENSHSNRLHTNSVAQAAASNNTIAFDVNGSTDNLFCCNFADQTRYGHKFMGGCDPTDLRHSTLDHHIYSVYCEEGTEIGLQYDKGNIFKSFTSGIAYHEGTDIEIANSQFKVPNNQSPHYPVFVSAPNETQFSPWFVLNGSAPSCEDENTGICEPPGDLPPFQEEENSERDISVARSNGFSTDPYGQMLQWEAQRRLYQRLKTFPELQETNTVIDSFYDVASSGIIGSYYEAEQAAREMYYHTQTFSETLRDISQQTDENAELVTAKLGELVQAVTEADSTVIYHVADSLFILGHEANMSLINHLSVADSIQKTKAQAALTLTNSLPAANILQSNRKTVNRIYLETLGQGIVQLDTQQFAAIAAIAHQCMLEGGNAVLDARVLYQLNEEKQFSDDTLCVPLEQRAVKQIQNNRTDLSTLRLMPNPAQNIVAIAGLPTQYQQPVKIVLSNNTGQVYKTLFLPEGSKSFSVHDLPNGIFFCQIFIGGIPESIQKLIILH